MQCRVECAMLRFDVLNAHLHSSLLVSKRPKPKNRSLFHFVILVEAHLFIIVKGFHGILNELGGLVKHVSQVLVLS